MIAPTCARLQAQRAERAALQMLISATLDAQREEAHARRLFLAALATPTRRATVAAAMMAEERAEYARAMLAAARRAHYGAWRCLRNAPPPAPSPEKRASWWARLIALWKGK